MKNIEVLVEPDEIHAFCRKLWRTDDFRQSHDDGGLVFEVIDKLASLPRFFYERSDDRLETGHFTSWWGGVQLRPNDYPKDGVHDLYYLHEMYHAATMPTIPNDLTRSAWGRKLNDNESDASVCSEISAYFAMPGLRAKTFDFEIYADRFLKDDYYHSLWRNNRREFEETMILHRRNVMSADYAPKDMPEKWIHLFASQNKESSPIWTKSYQMIEGKLSTLRRECYDSKIGRKQAMQNFMDWLQSDEITKGTDIPFPEEAKTFADIYWRNKKLYTAEADAFAKAQKAASATAPKPQTGGPAPKLQP